MDRKLPFPLLFSRLQLISFRRDLILNYCYEYIFCKQAVTSQAFLIMMNFLYLKVLCDLLGNVVFFLGLCYISVCSTI